MICSGLEPYQLAAFGRRELVNFRVEIGASFGALQIAGGFTLRLTIIISRYRIFEKSGLA